MEEADSGNNVLDLRANCDDALHKSGDASNDLIAKES